MFIQLEIKKYLNFTSSTFSLLVNFMPNSLHLIIFEIKKFKK